jgi:hypothetical protein
MEDEGYFVCGSPDHWAKKCPNRKVRKPQPKQKTVNMVVSSSGGGTSGYGNLSSVLSVFQSTSWWLDTGANVHVCSNASLLSSNQVTCFCSWCWDGRSDINFGKDRAAEERVACPYYQ